MLLFLFFCLTLLLHRRQPIGDIVLVALTKFMCPDAEGIVRYINLTEVTPFVSLAHPILQQERQRRTYYSLSKFAQIDVSYNIV